MELRCIRLGLNFVVGLGPQLSGQPPAFAADPAREARISQCSSEMTLEQKVGQLIQADIGSITPDDLRHYPLGSILNGGSSSPGNHEFAPPSEWLALADRFYEVSRDSSHGGHNNLVGATIFPHNIGLAVVRDDRWDRARVRQQKGDSCAGPELGLPRQRAIAWRASLWC